jgi:hypothetical protein
MGREKPRLRVALLIDRTSGVLIKFTPIRIGPPEESREPGGLRWPGCHAERHRSVQHPARE